MVDAVNGAPGESVSVAAHLTARREPVAAIDLSFGFQPAAPVAADGRGRPDCQVNPAIDKGASAFVFEPMGCQSTASCTAVHALVLSLDSVAPIADGAELFTCRVAIAPGATAGRYPLTVTGATASTPDGVPVQISGVDGAVTVLGQGTQHLASGGSASGCQIRPEGGMAQALLVVIPLLQRGLLKRRRRNRRQPSGQPVEPGTQMR